MVDIILKISRPGVSDIRCLNWKNAIIVFMKKCRMDRRRYNNKSRHLIPTFIGTPCLIRAMALCLVFLICSYDVVVLKFINTMIHKWYFDARKRNFSLIFYVCVMMHDYVMVPWHFDKWYYVWCYWRYNAMM